MAALRTSLGKVPGSKLIALGTRPADEDHFFAKMLESAPYSQVHAARPEDPPFRKTSIRRANPSYDHLPSLQAQIAEELVDAKIDADALASYRALRLNQGVDDVQRHVLVELDTWKRAVALAAPDIGSDQFVLGIDLGQNEAMSGAAAYFFDGRLEAVAAFPEHPSLDERGTADSVGDLYRRMWRRGELILAGELVADIPELLAECLARWGRPVAVVADRWRAAALAQALNAIHFPMADFILRGQGYKDGGDDVRTFRKAVVGGHVRPQESLLLRSAVAEARVIGDPAGNWKLAKKTEGGRRAAARDDAAAAAILAVAEGWRRWHFAPVKPRRPLRSALAG